MRLLASVALAFLAGAPAISLVAPAAAMPGDYYYFDPYSPNPIVRPSPRRDPDTDLKPRPNSKPGLKAESAKDFGALPKGPLQIVVSIANQHVTLYSNGVHVAQGPVSTGVPGRPTPTGVFSIIQKDRFHHSNLYSNAPMPFMERITWSGVALHEGPLPGYPASHGCIRMTHDFAARLWQIARLGVRVIVAHNEVVPIDFAHPSLFAPKPKPTEPPVASDDPDKHAEAASPVHLAQAATARSDSATAAGGAGALRETTETERGGAIETTETVPAPAGAPAATVAAPAVVDTNALPTDPSKPATDAADPAKPPPPPLKAAGQPVKHAGTVAVFVSRKEKKVYVRQGFAPLFDMAIEIEHPEQPLGTHVFTALGFTGEGTAMRWNVMSMAAEAPRPQIATKIGSKMHAETRTEPYVPQTPAQALDRIKIPQEAVDRIDEILSPGASLVISDQGLGPETGEGTDFIVLTR
jgi:lipoprotein-anchoring transpeptidase ErfK/SrfK